METFNVKSFLTDYQRMELNEYSLDQCREAIELLERRIKQLTNADYQSYMEKDIKDLSLSKRAYNTLLQAGFDTVGDVMNYGLENIAVLKGCGSLTHNEIKEAILKDMPKSR